jgi:lysylphosphatidylglycerol synthetase-like protein (DUF2156 family)
MQHDDKPIREIDDTVASAAEDRFEEILEKVTAKGAEIERDEESPLYVDVGNEEFEIGEERVVEFNMKGMDFQITRKVRKARIVGEGHHKSLEELSRPGIDIKLKRKPEISDQWVVVDMEDMF